MFRHRSLAPFALTIGGGGLMAVACLASTARVVAAPAEGRFDLLTGQYWQQIFDPSDPAAPPHLIPEDSMSTRRLPHRSHVLCLKAGDHVLIHAAGAQSFLSMEATALEKGAAGDSIRVRITVTAAVVEVTVMDATSGVLVGPVQGPVLNPIPRRQ